jgi:uncharacterized CHY-type Zn-finger protein
VLFKQHSNRTYRCQKRIALPHSPENIPTQTKTTTDTAICRYCKKELTLDNFNADKRNANGRYSICKLCRSETRTHSRISQDEYNALLQAQNYSCAICGLPAEESARGLSVDHSHYTHQIRGLLCVQCNLGLGYFKDNKQRLKAAIEYLEATDA